MLNHEKKKKKKKSVLDETKLEGSGNASGIGGKKERHEGAGE
jgi:hypothetical protein